MEFLKGRGEFFALIATLLIIFTWLKTDLSTMHKDMATKADIARVEANISKVEADLKADIACLEKDIARVELRISKVEEGLKAELREVKGLIITHITIEHKGHSHNKAPRHGLASNKHKLHKNP